MRDRRAHSEPLNLFQACPRSLQWSQLPEEVQQQAVRLMVRLLREHRDT